MSDPTPEQRHAAACYLRSLDGSSRFDGDEDMEALWRFIADRVAALREQVANLEATVCRRTAMFTDMVADRDATIATLTHRAGSLETERDHLTEQVHEANTAVATLTDKFHDADRRRRNLEVSAGEEMAALVKQRDEARADVERLTKERDEAQKAFSDEVNEVDILRADNARHRAAIETLRAVAEEAEKMRRLVVKVVCSPAAPDDAVVVASAVVRALDKMNLESTFTQVLAATAEYAKKAGTR